MNNNLLLDKLKLIKVTLIMLFLGNRIVGLVICTYYSLTLTLYISRLSTNSGSDLIYSYPCFIKLDEPSDTSGVKS